MFLKLIRIDRVYNKFCQTKFIFWKAPSSTAYHFFRKKARNVLSNNCSKTDCDLSTKILLLSPELKFFGEKVTAYVHKTLPDAMP